MRCTLASPFPTNIDAGPDCLEAARNESSEKLSGCELIDERILKIDLVPRVWRVSLRASTKHGQKNAGPSE